MIRKLEKINMTKAIYHYNEFGEKVFGITRKMSGDSTGLRGDCSDLIGDCSGLVGDCSMLIGDCTGLVGDCSMLIGDCTGISGDLDMCNITNDERDAGVNIADLIFKSEEEK